MLSTIKSLEDSLEGFWDCQDKDQLAELVKDRVKQRKPITELRAALETGVKELRKAVAAHDQRAASLKSSRKKEKADKSKKSDSKQLPVFEQGMEQSPEIQQIDIMTGLQDARSDEPFMFRLPGDVSTALAQEVPWAACVCIVRFGVLCLLGASLVILFRTASRAP